MLAKVFRLGRIILLLAVCLPAPSASAEKQPLRVFIVQSYGDNHVCGIPQAEGIRAALEKELKTGITIETHYMRSKTANSDPDNMQADAAKAMAAIKRYMPDIVFTIDDNAFREVGLDLIGAAFPVVFSGMNGQPETYNRLVPFLDAKKQPMANITGVYEKLHLTTALNVMTAINPQVKRIVALLDMSPTGNAIKIQMQKELAEGDSRVDVVFRQVATVQDYECEIAAINGDPTIQAVYPVVLSLKDGSGKSVGFEVTIKKFVRQSKKPGLALNFGFARLGLFGGASVDFRAMGYQAGRLGAKLLADADISGLPIESAREYLITFNYARAKMLGVALADEIIGAAIIYNRMELLSPDG